MPLTPRSGKGGSSRRSVQLHVEALEARLAPAKAAPLGEAVSIAVAGHVALVGDTLMIEGTSGPDHILILPTRQADTVRVVLNGAVREDFGPAARILVQAGAGDDNVFVSPQITLPARIEGGPGDDRLRGGGGPDLLLGEEGDDWLIGTSGRDALDAGPGQNHVVVPQTMGELLVGPSAAGDALRMLSQAYDLQPLGTTAETPTGPMVVGGADLADASLVDLLKRSYEEGHPIALAGATAADVEALSGLLGHEGGANWDPAFPQADLVVFRKALRPDGQMHFSVSILLPRLDVQTASKHSKQGAREADERATEWLSTAFSATPVVPEPPPGDSPENNLIQLANSYQSSVIQSDAYGNDVQIVNSVWAARSFQNQKDLYYVLQEIDYHVGEVFTHVAFTEWNNSATNTLLSPSVPPTPIQPSPQSTGKTTTVTSSVSANFGGNVGYNELQGFNATGSAGLMISNSESVVIPPITITYLGDPATGVTSWKYVVNDLPESAETITFFNQWIWEVAFDTYDEQKIIYIQSQAKQTLANPVIHVEPQLIWYVPLPFGRVFALEQPHVTSVSPSGVNVGDKFTITGTGFYPSLVTAVLIDGEPLDPTQYTTVSDTKITVIAPDTLGFFLPVVVKTKQGVSNDDVTVRIIP